MEKAINLQFLVDELRLAIIPYDATSSKQHQEIQEHPLCVGERKLPP